MIRNALGLLLVLLWIGCGPRWAPHVDPEKNDPSTRDTGDPLDDTHVEDTHVDDTVEDTHVDDTVDDTESTGPDADGDGHLAIEDGGGDCDDTNSRVNPDAVERLGNGQDDDCDGTVDVVSKVEASAEFQEIELGGGLGLAVAGTGNFLAGAGASLALGAPFAEGEGASGGCVHLFAADVSGEVVVETAAAVLMGEAESEAGKALAGRGDANGDGIDDLLVGGYHGADGAGLTWLVHGPVSGQQSLSSVGIRIQGQHGQDFSAQALDFAGDVDGDGFDEILVGAYHANTVQEGSYEGAAYLVDPPISGGMSLDDAIRFQGASEGDELGYAVAGPGDMDGDGFAELALGARYEGTAGEYAGAVYVLAGPATGISTVSDADSTWTGEVAGAYAGSALAGAGDVNGDGHADLLVGSRRQDGSGDSSGAAHVLFGPLGVGGSLQDAQARLLGIDAGDRAGWAIAGGGDVNADGFDDVWVGAPRNGEGAQMGGAVYLALGPLSAVVSLQDANGRILGSMVQNLLGVSVDGLGDVDGDGRADVVVGAEGGGTLVFRTDSP